MRTLSKLVVMAALLAAAPAPAAFAQTGDKPNTTSAQKIAVQQPWARATPAGAKTGAAYMTLANTTGTADRLTSISSDVAATVQIHQTKVVNGVMQMRQVTGGVAIPAGGSVALNPGSYHVMLIGLKKPLVAGQSISLTLTFANAGNISVTVPVKAIGASGPSSGSGGMGGMGGMPHDPSGGMGKMEMK